MDTEIFPVVLDNRMFVAVGSQNSISDIQYIVGETSLDKESEKEKELWLRANRVAILEEFEQVVKFLVDGNIEYAKELATSIKEHLLENDASWKLCIDRLKIYLDELPQI